MVRLISPEQAFTVNMRTRRPCWIDTAALGFAAVLQATLPEVSVTREMEDIERTFWRRAAGPSLTSRLQITSSDRPTTEDMRMFHGLGGAR